MKKPLTAEEIEKEISALAKLANSLPMRLAGRHLMKVAGLKRQLLEIQSA